MNNSASIKQSVVATLARVIPFGWLKGLLPNDFILCGHLVAGPDHFVRNYYRYPSLAEFDRFINWMQSLGYEFVTFEDYRKKDSRKKLLLTFDDGFSALYGEAREYLRSRKIPYVLFILSDALKDPLFQIKTILPSTPPEQRTFLTEQEILVMRSEGVHIGFHSRSHNKVEPHHINDAAMLEQLSIPAEFRPLFSEPLSFAYPYYAPSNYRKFNDHMRKEFGYSYFFDVKGFLQNETTHFFRAYIDATKTTRGEDFIKYSIKVQLVALLIIRVKKSLFFWR